MKDYNIIKTYLNKVVGVLPNRRVEVVKRGENTFELRFIKLINLEEEDCSNFKDSDHQILYKRDYSKWAILFTRVTLSREAFEIIKGLNKVIDDIKMTTPYDVQT